MEFGGKPFQKGGPRGARCLPNSCAFGPGIGFKKLSGPQESKLGQRTIGPGTEMKGAKGGASFRRVIFRRTTACPGVKASAGTRGDSVPWKEGRCRNFPGVCPKKPAPPSPTEQKSGFPKKPSEGGGAGQKRAGKKSPPEPGRRIRGRTKGSKSRGSGSDGSQNGRISVWAQKNPAGGLE